VAPGNFSGATTIILDEPRKPLNHPGYAIERISRLFLKYTHELIQENKSAAICSSVAGEGRDMPLANFLKVADTPTLHKICFITL